MAFLILKKRRKVSIQQTRLQKIEIIENFKYRKNNNGYWDRVKLYKQVVNKMLPISEVFYSKYLFFFYLIIL